MTAPATLLRELHTTDLMDPCPRAVQLRHEGRVIREAPRAMFTGSLWHKAAQLYFADEHDTPIAFIVDVAREQVLKEYRDEGKELTPTVEGNMAEICGQVAGWLQRFHVRFAQYFAQCTIIGCELPIRMTVDVDGYPIEFASTLDLLFRDPHGMLCDWDYKTPKESPSQAFLDRNMQLGMYWVGLLKGEVMLNGHYERFDEQAIVSWFHVQALLPYSKKVTAKDDTGRVRDFFKGDERPTRLVVREQLYTNAQAILDEFRLRVRMHRAGLFPAFPDPQSCRFCDARVACPSWVSDPRPEEEGDDE